MKKIQEILSLIKYIQFIGNENVVIKELKNLDTQNQQDDVLFWCKDQNLPLLKHLTHGTVICSSKIQEVDFQKGCNFILVENPKLVYARIMKEWIEKNDLPFGIHPTAIVHPEACLHPNVTIGPYCIIGKCKMDEGTRLMSHVVVKDNVTIGKRVLIHDHATLGSKGFGFIRNEQNHLEGMMDFGEAIIEDDVEIFSYSNIDCGTLGETRVKRGTKIALYSQVGHNCTIGEDCIITSGVVFAGGSRMGNFSWVGLGSVIKEKVIIGDHVLIGMGAVVTKNIPDNSIWFGNPAKPREDFKKI